MSTILIRTLIIYIIIVFSMKLMGKRQIGELRLSEFVIALLLSELAAYAVMDTNIPLVYAVIPIVTLTGLEVFVSSLSTKNNAVRRIFNSSPSILIERGEINQAALKSTRFTIEELLTEIRLKGHPSIFSIDYAILEANGKLSIIPKSDQTPPTVQQLGISPDNTGITFPVIINGELNLDAIKAVGKTCEWILSKAQAQGYSSLGEIFLMVIDNTESVSIIKKV